MKEAPLSSYLQLDGAAATRAERYSVTAVLGEGGAGRVLLGKDTLLNRDVAIKVILLDESFDPSDARARFYREAQAMATLDHPGIVRVLDYSGPDVSSPYLVCERLHGLPLSEWIERAPLPESALVAVALELCSALAHAHTRGLLHRDVKPDNVVIQPDGRVVLIDFGLAKGWRSDAERQTFIAGKTRLVGSPMFGSPEQLFGSAEVSVRSDLYGLGATLYFAATQVYPFNGDSVTELFDAIRAGKRHKLDALVTLSQPVNDLIEQLLSVEPGHRSGSAVDVAETLRKLSHAPPRDALMQWMADTPVSGSTTINRPKVATLVLPKKRAPFWMMALAVLAVIGAWVLFHKPAAPTPVVDTPLAAPFPVALPAPAAPEPQPDPMPEAVESPPTPPPKRQGRATLRVVVKPWGEVSIDGEPRGTTPRFQEATLTTGSHTVEVTHPVLGKKTQRVSLSQAGETKTLVVDLRE